MLHGKDYTHVQIFKNTELVEAVGSKRGVIITIEDNTPFMVSGRIDLILGVIEDYEIDLPSPIRSNDDDISS